MTYLQREGEAVATRIFIMEKYLRARLGQWDSLGAQEKAGLAWAIGSLLVWGHVRAWRLRAHAAIHGVGGAI